MPSLGEIQKQIESADELRKASLIVQYERAFHDAQAEYYDDILSDPEPIRTYMRRMVTEIYGLVSDSPFVVDLCCGTGKSSLPLIERGIEVIGIDVSEPMLRRYRAKARSSKLHLIQADCTAPPLEPDSCSAILLIGGLHHLPDRQAAVHNACRALKPGGLLIVHEPLATGQSHWLLPWIRTFDELTNPLRILRAIGRRLGRHPPKSVAYNRLHFTPYEHGFRTAEELVALVPDSVTTVNLRSRCVFCDYQLGNHLQWCKPLVWCIAALDEWLSRTGRAGWSGNAIWGVFQKSACGPVP